MHVTVRIRIFLARHGWVRWAIVLVLAAGVGWGSHQRAAAVERERASWGTTVDVVVAGANLVPDGAIDVIVRALPVAMLPTEALTTLPTDARLRQHVVEGAVLTSADITAASGPAALAEPGTAVVGIVDPLVRHASIGLTVAVASEGVTLANHATVVAVDNELVLIAVPRSEAPAVAAAAQLGSASLLFLP